MIATTAFVLLLVSLLIQIIFVYRKDGKTDPTSTYFLATACALLIVVTIRRSLMIEFVAITTTYEALLLFAEMVLIVLVTYRIKTGTKAQPFVMVGGTIVAFILLALSSSPIISSEVIPPVPALRSSWLVMHIIFAFLGEAFFTVAFLGSIYFISVRSEEKKLQADAIIYKSTIIGYFLFTTGGLIFGAVWAYNAWGRYWGWDPKETSAFVTWLVYTLYLHLRIIKKYRGTITAVVQIAGYILTLVTFLGINYLAKGLHSY